MILDRITSLRIFYIHSFKQWSGQPTTPPAEQIFWNNVFSRKLCRKQKIDVRTDFVMHAIILRIYLNSKSVSLWPRFNYKCRSFCKGLDRIFFYYLREQRSGCNLTKSFHWFFFTIDYRPMSIRVFLFSIIEHDHHIPWTPATRKSQVLSWLVMKKHAFSWGLTVLSVREYDWQMLILQGWLCDTKSVFESAQWPSAKLNRSYKNEKLTIFLIPW